MKEELEEARQLRDEAKEALNNENIKEAKKKFLMALDKYENCLAGKGTSYAPVDWRVVEQEKEEVEKRLSELPSLSR